MKAHRTIWTIALACAAVAALLAGPRTVHAPAPGNPGELAARTLAALEEDPLVRGDATRRQVFALAAWAGKTGEAAAEAWYALGLRCRNLRDMQGAADALEKAAALRPGWNWPWSMLGIVRYDLGDTAGAERAFRRAIELDPERSRTYSDFGVILRREGRIEEAASMARKALELEPNGLAEVNNYGNILFVQGRYEEARQAYLKAVEIDPAHASPYYNLACVASLQGDASAAAEALESAIARNAAFRELARSDPDLDPVRGDARIQAVLSAKTLPGAAAPTR